MRRFLTFAAMMTFLCFTLVFAAEKPSSAPSATPPRIPEMNTAGTVLEMSESSLKIERTLKGNREIMDFSLQGSLPSVAAGDSVKISYREKDGRNVLIRLAPAKKTEVKKAVKKGLPKEMRPLTPAAVPQTK